jgi:hypothetical protein
MGFLERNKMSDKYREAVLTTVLTYQECARATNSDPLRLLRLSAEGVPFTGKELAKKLGVDPNTLGDNDSVWWVTGDPDTMQVTSHVQIATDIGDFRKAINKQLKKWGKKSALKELAKKRAIIAGAIAAVVVVVVVAIVFAPAVGVALKAAGGAIAAAAKTLSPNMIKAFKGIGAGIVAGGLTKASEGIMGNLTPKEQQQVVQSAKESAKETDKAVEGKETPEWLYPTLGVGAVLALALIFVAKK